MSTIRNEIDQELKEMKLPSDFADNIISMKGKDIKPFYKKFSAAAVLICTCVILGTTAIAGYVHYQDILVNKKSTPELDEMTIHPYALEGTKLNRTVHKEYNDYESLKKEMPFPLLDSKYANNDEMIKIVYRSEPYRNGIQTIVITGFILGDVKDLEISEDRTAYSCSSGKEFDSPVNLLIDIISDEKLAAKNLVERQFEGTCKFTEQYISKQGYKVNIISHTGRPHESKQMHCAIFVVDGIRYTLDGDVTLDKMKEIVDSMEY